jgi:hypothetical protein
VFDSISARVGTFMAGEPARGMPKLFGLDCDMAVSTSQSPWTDDGGDIGFGLGDGVKYVGEVLRSLDFPIFRMRLRVKRRRVEVVLWTDSKQGFLPSNLPQINYHSIQEVQFP